MRKFLVISLLFSPSLASAQDWGGPAGGTDPAGGTTEETPVGEAGATETTETPAVTRAAPPAGEGVFKPGTMGLSFGVPSGGGPTFGFTYFPNATTAYRVDFGLAMNSTTGPDPMDPSMETRTNTLGFSVEFGYRMYKKIAGSLHTFLQPGFFFAKAPDVTGAADFMQLVTIAIPFGIGAEYFFSERFSVSGMTGGALAIRNELKDFALTTGTSLLSANFYW